MCGYQSPTSWKLRWSQSLFVCQSVYACVCVCWHLHLYRIMSIKHFRPCLFTLLRLVGLNVCVPGCFALLCVCIRICFCGCIFICICISVALAHVLCAVRPKSCHCRASSDWKNWTSDPRFQHPIFAHSLKLTKINFSANNRIYTCEPTWCGDEIKTRPGQTHRLELL